MIVNGGDCGSKKIPLCCVCVCVCGDSNGGILITVSLGGRQVDDLQPEGRVEYDADDGDGDANEELIDDARIEEEGGRKGEELVLGDLCGSIIEEIDVGIEGEEVEEFNNKPVIIFLEDQS